eukprot:254826_1
MGTCQCTLPKNKIQEGHEMKMDVELKKQIKSTHKVATVSEECAERACVPACKNVESEEEDSDEDTISPLPTLQTFDTNEAWNMSSGKDSGELEVSEIKLEIKLLERTLTGNSESGNELEGIPHLRHGSNLISKESVETLTETQIEESQHDMEAQIAYLKEELASTKMIVQHILNND